MTPIVTVAEMRSIDEAAPEPVDELVRRAAWHVATRARAMLGGVYGRRVAVLAGPGNNGADARVAAEFLRRWGVRTDMIDPLDPRRGEIGGVELVIDGAFGTGLNRAYDAPKVAAGVPVLAIDIASGVNGDTGELLGRTLQASHTVSFAALKPGLLLVPGAQRCGSVEVVDIGLDTSSARAHRVDESDAVAWLPHRAVDAHKWSRAVRVVGGSPGMYGAPVLASHAAMRAGSGMVRCGLPEQRPPSLVDEVVFDELPARWADEVLADADRYGAFVVGPGLGRSDDARHSVAQLIDRVDAPMVLDGDALRLLGPDPELGEQIVLTPHDGEYEGLTGRPPAADRFAATRALAHETGATVLLKGPLTIVATPSGRCLAVDTGDDRLATAGTGDVLAGAIGAHLAAGLEPAQAAALGAWMHGRAASGQPRMGMVASDLIDGLARVATHLHTRSLPGESHATH